MADMPSVFEFSSSVADQEAPPVLPAGTYIANVKHVEAKISATSGNKYAAVTFHIPPDQFPPDFLDGPADGLTLGYNMVVLEDTPRARYNIKKFCDSIDAPLPTTSLDLTSWLGREAKVVTKVDKWQGEERAQIDRVQKV